MGGFPKELMLSRTWFLKILSFVFFSHLLLKLFFLKKNILFLVQVGSLSH